jgi:outer membrane lipoprotein carrier protein
VRLVTLVPKAHDGDAHRTVQKIVVEVFPKTYFIRSLWLYEPSGNVTNFEFSSLQSNIGLGDDLFVPKLPPDVEIVKAPVLGQP